MVRTGKRRHMGKIADYEWNLCISEKTTNFVGLIATKCSVGEFVRADVSQEGTFVYRV